MMDYQDEIKRVAENLAGLARALNELPFSSPLIPEMSRRKTNLISQLRGLEVWANAA